MTNTRTASDPVRASECTPGTRLLTPNGFGTVVSFAQLPGSLRPVAQPGLVWVVLDNQPAGAEDWDRVRGFEPADLAWDYETEDEAVCDVCARPHRVDLSGPRCFDCRLVHGPAPAPENTRLVRVEDPAPGENARAARADWEAGA